MAPLAPRRRAYARSAIAAAVLALATTGCVLEEAPPSLERVFDDTWNLFEQGTDEELGALLRDILVVVDGDALKDGRQRGTQNRLTQAHLDLMQFDPGGPKLDPRGARPIYLLERYACTIPQLDNILIYHDQNELYGKYEDYGRTFVEAERSAYRKGTVNTLGWTGFLRTYIVFGEYIYRFRTEIRRVPIPDDVDLPADHFILVRSWLTQPAEWTFGDHDFPQDYQFEIFVPWTANEVVHLYPVWREMRVTGAGDMESDSFASFNLDQMAGWGDRTAQLCAEGLP